MFNEVPVYHFMAKDLKLKRNDLVAYAFIYAASEDGVSEYIGGAKALSKHIGVSYQTAINILNRLIARGYIGYTIIDGHKSFYATRTRDDVK